MSWSTGITLFFILFAGSMTTAVIATTKYTPQLVQQDYYALDVEYQAHLEKKQRTAALSAPPTVLVDATNQQVMVTLPAGMTATAGKLNYYRSATTRDDITISIDQSMNRIILPAQRLKSGRWHLTLDWTDQHQLTYYWATTFFQP
jgi:nitrogen fixation protein FixH